MPRAVLLVLTNPTGPDREDEYNEWYTNTHVPDVLGVDGFVAATRYRLSETQMFQTEETAKHRYLAVYEIDSDDLAAAMQKLGEAAVGGMVISEALDMTTTGALLFEQMGPRQSEK